MEKLNITQTNNFWKNLTKERQKLLDKIDFKKWKEWELDFEQQLEEKLFIKNVKKPFFRWELLLNDKINFYILIGNANIGKSYASRKLILDYVKKGKRFIILRTSKVEMDNYKSSLKDWLKENGMNIVKDTIIDIATKQTLGFTIALSTSLNWKSSEFGNVELIVYDEFMKPNDKLKDKLNLLTRLILTAQRQNPNFKVLLISNYIKNEDDVLVKLGFTNFETTGDLVFNPLTKAMLWCVPSNVFREFKTQDNLGFILSLDSKKSYADNFGGEFTNNTTKNLLNKDWNMKADKPLFGLFHMKHFMLFSKMEDKILVDFALYEELRELNIPIYTLSREVFLKFRETIWIGYEHLANLLPLYYDETILINGDIDIRADLNYIFSIVLEKQNSISNNLFRKIKIGAKWDL